MIIPDHALGLPVLRALSLCTCCRHYPGAAAGRIPRSISPSRGSLPRKGCRVGLHIDIFEACSAFIRVAACTLALSPIRDTLIEGFSHFVTSMTAPIASGWSESPGGPCTHWKAPPCHGAPPKPSLVRAPVRLSWLGAEVRTRIGPSPHGMIETRIVKIPYGRSLAPFAGT